MKKNINNLLNLLVASALVTLSGGAIAQSAGTWMVKVGINKITPKVQSDDLSAPALPGTKADVGSDTEPVVVGTYMITDNFQLRCI